MKMQMLAPSSASGEDDEGEVMIGVRREEQFSSKSVHSLRLVVLLKAEGFAWPPRSPILFGGHSPRSVGMLCPRL